MEGGGEEALLLVYLVVHLSIVVWAISNRHPWGAIGVFLFPVVGDIAYVIYYFGSRERADPLVPRASDTPEGAIFETARAVRPGGLTGLVPPGTPVRVTRRLTSSSVEAELPNGTRGNFYRSELRPIEKQIGEEAQPKAESPTTPHPSTTPQSSNWYAEIRELAVLLEEGLITEEEFRAKKRQILGL